MSRIATNVHLDIAEVEIVNRLLQNLFQHNPNFKKSWDANPACTKISKRLEKANRNAKEQGWI